MTMFIITLKGNFYHRHLRDIVTMTVDLLSSGVVVRCLLTGPSTLSLKPHAEAKVQNDDKVRHLWALVRPHGSKTHEVARACGTKEPGLGFRSPTR